MRVVYSCILLVFYASFAQAHIGHVGDLAGHAHWLGLAAGVAAIAVAAALAKGKKTSENEAEVEDADSVSEDEVGETA